MISYHGNFQVCFNDSLKCSLSTLKFTFCKTKHLKEMNYMMGSQVAFNRSRVLIHILKGCQSDTKLKIAAYYVLLFSTQKAIIGLTPINIVLHLAVAVVFSFLKIVNIVLT